KTVPLAVGWQPICTERFEYEMDVMLILPQGSNGVPDLDAKATGFRDPLQNIFKSGEQLSEDHGKQLVQGDSGKASSPTAKPAATKDKTPAPKGFVIQKQKSLVECQTIDDWQGKMLLAVAALDGEQCKNFRVLNGQIMGRLDGEGFKEQVEAVEDAFDAKIGEA
ncbi:hypothetical protein LCGC14_2088540, partial [marine sediment metagenome]